MRILITSSHHADNHRHRRPHSAAGQEAQPQNGVVDDPILRQVKKLSRERKASLGRVVSDLLGRALEAEERPAPAELDFVVREMRPRYDLDDREALLDAMDGSEEQSEHPKRGGGCDR